MSDKELESFANERIERLEIRLKASGGNDENLKERINIYEGILEGLKSEKA